MLRAPDLPSHTPPAWSARLLHGAGVSLSREHTEMRIGRRDVRLTNLDKLFFPGPGLTKGDLIAYYVDVADCVLHHVRRRPMHMVLRFA